MDEKFHELRALLGQIRMLRAEADKVQPQSAEKQGRPGSGITALIKPFNLAVRRAVALLEANPTALSYAEQIELANEEIEERHSASYHTKARQQILVGCGTLLAVLEPLVAIAVDVPTMKVDREGVFFAGQYYDALQRARQILVSARTSIFIVDGYLGQEILDLLTVKNPNVEIHILTRSVSPAIHTAASAFNKQYTGLSIRTTAAFHDRFVVIDDLDFYHFGASLKDLGNKGFMFSRIEEPVIVDLLRKQLLDVWKTAALVI